MIPKEKVNSPPTSPGIERDTELPLVKIADKLEALSRSIKGDYIAPNTEPSREQLLQQISDLSLLTQYQEALFSSLPQGIIMVDSDGKVITYNKAAEKLLGISSGEVLFQSFWKNFSDNALGFSLRQTLKEKRSPGIVTTKGGEKEIEAEAAIVDIAPTLKGESRQSPKFSFKGLIIMFRDVTDHKHHEIISQRKHRMHELGEMAALVAHEIRNPLGGIKGFASLLERDLTDRPDLKKMASYIIEGTNNLNDLVSRILSYARPITTRYEPVNLVSLVQQIRDEILKEEAYSRNYKFEILCQHNSLVATVDLESMRQSITHLIVNAIQAMPDGGGKITIVLEQDDKHLFIKVKDTGIGIPPENISKIFSPFFTTRPDGNGFGLSEVHKIIQLHGGKVDVESQVGVGSTFTLKLPIKESGAGEDILNKEGAL